MIRPEECKHPDMQLLGVPLGDWWLAGCWACGAVVASRQVQDAHPTHHKYRLVRQRELVGLCWGMVPWGLCGLHRCLLGRDVDAHDPLGRGHRHPFDPLVLLELDDQEQDQWPYWDVLAVTR